MLKNASHFRYWGKADKDTGQYHLLPYHCLDVAAVAHVWLQQSNVIRKHFEVTTALSQTKAYAWVLFFITLHDLGKFDVRFQNKVPDISNMLWPEFSNADRSQSNRYWHGDYSSYWVFNDLNIKFKWDDWLGDEEKWEAWQPWIYAVAGHHGVIPSSVDGNKPGADNNVIEHDKEARLAFICAIENIFLEPAGLSLNDDPPSCDQDFLAGFCSICDWLGSSQMNMQGEDRFTYENRPIALRDYFSLRIPIAEQTLKESGLYQSPFSNGGMKELFPKYNPRLVQTLVNELSVHPGLTIIESPTGSGKTEAALAYASLLLAEGIAESIIFALPTQATANAMFDRLLEVTERIFADSNLLLAHGKARFNTSFINLQKITSKRSVQDIENETEASIQCSQWLFQSRKRVFLGQIGVCTIDQVLISVLPVKHKFVRSFGLGKSVLIVDEVHAYDSYMYGLLNGVLKKQQQMQGCMILLSATLPQHQKESLILAWGGHVEQQGLIESYPLITHISQKALPKLLRLPEKEQKRLENSQHQVHLDVVEQTGMQFDNELLIRVIEAANLGANVVIICNLVADAQSTAQRLRKMGAADIDLFHSRFRFRDRQQKEQAVLTDYGKGKAHKKGGVLVATQVVEQSLDLDFDWMLTQ
ncbi:MAG: CRISPR-associated helicase/endonuclease Cas3, partial [Simkaniaceae bacterium]|nr:CRISPR-associated helicase/endonuclease Cas3 [Simkaniaceae bacterium]